MEIYSCVYRISEELAWIWTECDIRPRFKVGSSCVHKTRDKKKKKKISPATSALLLLKTPQIPSNDPSLLPSEKYYLGRCPPPLVIGLNSPYFCHKAMRLWISESWREKTWQRKWIRRNKNTGKKKKDPCHQGFIATSILIHKSLY